MEECSEVQQAISKALRFGLKDSNPNTPRRNNAEDIAHELIDILSIRDMLLHNTAIPPLDEVELKEAKIAKLKKYIKISTEVGIIK